MQTIQHFAGRSETKMSKPKGKLHRLTGYSVAVWSPVLNRWRLTKKGDLYSLFHDKDNARAEAEILSCAFDKVKIVNVEMRFKA